MIPLPFLNQARSTSAGLAKMNLKWKLLLPMLAGYAGQSYAVDWLFMPEFSSNERYDDNVTLQVDQANAISSLITSLAPSVMLGYQLPNSNLKTNFKWNELIYHNASQLDFSEKLFNLHHDYAGEWFKTGLDASYNEQSSITTQLDENGSGLLVSRLVPVTRRSISPNILFYLDERNSLRFDYSYQDVAFQRPKSFGSSIGFADYSNQQISATEIYNFSKRLTLTATGSYSLFDSSSNGSPLVTLCTVDNTLYPCKIASGYQQQSTTFFYQAGAQYAFDELTQLSVSAGMRDSDNRIDQSQNIAYAIDPKTGEPYFAAVDNLVTSNSTASGHVFSASLTRSFELGNISLNAGQQLNPSSSGQQQQTTSFGGQGRFNLSDRWSTGLNFSHQISQSTLIVSSKSNGAKPLSNNRTYTTITPDIQWRWTPEIKLQLSYTHREQELVDRGLSASGNIVQLMFSYQPELNRQVK